MAAAIDLWTFFDRYGNAASVVSFFIALAGFICSIVLQLLTKKAVSEAKAEVERARDEARRQVAEFTRRLALQILGGEVEQALRYNREARSAGDAGRWPRAKDLFADTKHSVARIAGNETLTLAENRGLRTAIEHLEAIARMIDAERRGPGAKHVFPEETSRLLNDIDTVLGGIRSRLLNAAMEVPHV